jgi:hypothetical protein
LCARLLASRYRHRYLLLLLLLLLAEMLQLDPAQLLLLLPHPAAAAAGSLVQCQQQLPRPLQQLLLLLVLPLLQPADALQESLACVSGSLQASAAALPPPFALLLGLVRHLLAALWGLARAQALSLRSDGDAAVVVGFGYLAGVRGGVQTDMRQGSRQVDAASLRCGGEVWHQY